MKIAMIGQKGIPTLFGGIERHVEELSLRMAKQKQLDVFVYVRNYYTLKKIKRYKKINLIHLLSLRTKHLDTISHTFFACLHSAFKLKPEVIHFHGIGPALLIWLPKLLIPSAKVIFTYHCQDYYHQKWGKIARFSLFLGEKLGCRYADEVIAVSEELAEYVRNKYKCSVKFIPHGVNQKDLNKADLIKRWGLARQEYILVVSRLIRHKGIHYLIKAYQELDLDKKLVIVGPCFYTSDYEKELKQIANLNPNILFLGRQSGKTLEQLYANAYLFINPSEQEGMPLSVLEAGGFGLPLLLSDISIHKKMFTDLPYFFENKNYQDLKKQLVKIIKENNKILARGGEIKEYARQKYDWDSVVEKSILAYA